MQYVFDGLEKKFYDECDLHDFDDREEIDIEGRFVGADAVMLTDKVREFIERYDGRSFEQRSAHFFIDMPFSEIEPDIFTVSATDRIAVKDDNFYLGCIFFGSEYDLENADMYIDKFGRLYDAGVYGTLTVAAESMEDFIGLYEEQRRINETVIEERIRIENKYFVSEIRTTSL